MISILPIQPDILQMMAEDTGLTAEGPVWGYFAAEGTKMLGYVVVERAEPVRIIALQCEDFVIADGLLRRALHPFYEEGSKGYTFACEVPMPLPMAYTRRGAGSLEAAAWALRTQRYSPCGPFCGEMPRKYRRNLKKPLAFFRWECYHNKVPSNSM